MPNSKADAAKSATGAGDAADDVNTRVPARGGASTDAAVPRTGVTITRGSLGLAVAVLGGAYMLQWDRTTRVQAEIRDTRVELRAEIGVLRAEMREEIGVLRAGMREESDVLRAEMREELGVLREDFRELAALIRARDAASE